MQVIAQTEFVDESVTPPMHHPWGHEFDAPEGAQLDAWLKDGLVRVDDRKPAQMRTPTAPPTE